MTVSASLEADLSTSVQGIDRRAGLSHRQFVEQYLRPLKPVILADAINHWPALGKWTSDFFCASYGSREVNVDGRQHVLRDLLELIERSAPGRPAPYLRNLLIKDWAPELLKDIMPMPACTEPNWFESRLFPSEESLTYVELYIGGAGAAFPVLHYDGMHTHAFLMQLQGTKEYLAYPPDQTRFLYPRQGLESNKSTIPDIDHPDLARFPLVAQAVGHRAYLKPGETLFVPSGWWHTARILEPSITVSLNTANAANWSAFCRDYIQTLARHQPKWRTAGMAVYLRCLGMLQQVATGA